MKKGIIHILLICIAFTLNAEYQSRQKDELEPGDKVGDFSLKNVDGSMVSLSDYLDENGVIIVFTSNSCPFATGYEDRILALHVKYAQKGFPVIAINPNDGKRQPDETIEKMKIKSESAGFPFPYLKDDRQLFIEFGAKRTPEVFLLERQGRGFKVAYKGAIDSQPIRTNAPNTRYLESAINALIMGVDPSPSRTPAVGCTIKSQ